MRETPASRNLQFDQFGNYDETKSLFDKQKPDNVIHLSTRVGGVFENASRMADFVRDNLYMD